MNNRGKRIQSYLQCLLLILGVVAFPITQASGESELASLTDPDLSLSLIKDGASNKENLRLKISARKLTESTVFSITNPNRIVIDLIGPKVKKNRNMSLPKGMSFSMIRVGAHPDKIRIVIDVTEPNIPSYKWKSRGNEALLSIATTSEELTTPEPVAVSRATEKPVIRTPTVKPASTPVTTEGDDIESLINRKPKPSPTPEPPEPEVEILPTPIPEIFEATIAPTPKGVAVATPVTTAQAEIVVLQGPVLAGINFAYSEDPNPRPIIKLALGERAQFQLERTNERTYVISISGFQLGKKSLALPQFPPHDFIGFTVVNAEEKSEGLVITVGVESDARIQAAPNGSEIWVSLLEEKKPERGTASVPKD